MPAALMPTRLPLSRSARMAAAKAGGGGGGGGCSGVDEPLAGRIINTLAVEFCILAAACRHCFAICTKRAAKKQRHAARSWPCRRAAPHMSHATLPEGLAGDSGAYCVTSTGSTR